MSDSENATLPLGWQRLTIGDITVPTKQRDPRRSPGPTFRYVDVSAVSNTSFRIVAADEIPVSEAPSRARKEIHANDVLFATVRPALERVALVTEDFDGEIASTGFCVLRVNPDIADPTFLYHFLLTDHFNQRMRELQRGASYPAVRDSDIFRELIPVPPLCEQRQIATVLSLVQRAIEQQERLIALTAELKKALMHKLFTEGLRGESQKQTEIGPIPESWEVVRLRDCATVQTGIAKGRKIDPAEAIELPYLRVANVQDGRLDLSEMKTITIRAREKERFLLRNRDIVLTEGGDFDKLGRGFIWRSEIRDCVHQNHIFAVRVDRDRLIPEFFAYQSQSPYGKAYFLSVAHKTTNLASINTTKLKNLPVLIPSLGEQQEVACLVESVDAKLEYHRWHSEHLNELFRTLLHQLMTAQIRVPDLDLDSNKPVQGVPQ